MPRTLRDAVGTLGSSLLVREILLYSHGRRDDHRVGDNSNVKPSKAAHDSVALLVFLRVGGKNLGDTARANGLSLLDRRQVCAIGVRPLLHPTTLCRVVREVNHLDEELVLLELWKLYIFLEREGVGLNGASRGVGEYPGSLLSREGHDE